jgi:hypothetical protein
MAKRLLLLAACTPILLAGCGSDKPVDRAQIRSVVLQFAEAGGPKACTLLSPQQLVNLYGGFKAPEAVARKRCIAKSKNFKGEPVRITSMQILDDATARVGAVNPKGDVTYTVNVRRFGPAWRIDRINQTKTE